MSGTCLTKKGRSYLCGQCERKGLRPDFDYCPFCGEEVVMRWNADHDCRLGEESDSAAPSQREST